MIARVFAVVDVFDALVTERPYKRGLPLREAMKILDAGIGSHFDPQFAPLSLGLLSTMFQRIGGLCEEALKPHITASIQRHFGA